MKKYYAPTIKIASFLRENVVTEASGLNHEYIGEVNTLIDAKQQAYTRMESVNDLLKFKLNQ